MTYKFMERDATTGLTTLVATYDSEGKKWQGDKADAMRKLVESLGTEDWDELVLWISGSRLWIAKS